jgi:DNA-binding response OmpR family regulator
MDKKILIVDDEPHIRALMEETLEDFEDEGVEILSASDGEEALEIAREEKPDLIYLDVMMPRRNGYEVCELIRQDEELKATYVVMLSAKGQEVDKEKGMECGVNEYMTKPFDPDLIIEKASEILGVEVEI